jgi:predicted RNase H-like HicB family nuclease
MRGTIVYQITLEIQHLPEGPYLGTSPELPGLIVQAETAEEVVALAPGIAKDLIEVMRENGEPLPEGLEPLEHPFRVTVTVPA